MANKKPTNPHPDFPLFPHGNGQWVKTITGRLHYFGRWDDPKAAVAKYPDQCDDLQTRLIDSTNMGKWSTKGGLRVACTPSSGRIVRANR